MKTILEAAYAIGDVVYSASFHQQARRLQCPDCLDTRQWEARTPAGDILTFACPRCGYQHDRQPRVIEFTPRTDRLTIGSIKMDTHDHLTQYMCVETGVGSGRVYNEFDLFATEDAATVSAKLKCANAAEQPEYKNHYDAAMLAAGSTFIASAINEEASRRRKYQFMLEDAQRAIFDGSLSDAHLRAQLRHDLETI